MYVSSPMHRIMMSALFLAALMVSLKFVMSVKLTPSEKMAPLDVFLIALFIFYNIFI